MGKVLKLLISSAAAMAVSGALFSAGASAQTSNNSLSSNALMETVSATEVASMLAEFQIGSQMVADPSGGAPVMIATTPGGAKFLIGFFDCANPASASGCKQTLVSTVQSSAGTTFDDLNTFNGNSEVTTVAYEAANQILIFGRNIYLPGGVGRGNYKLQVALFLRDMQQYVQGRQTSAASVSFSANPVFRSKIDGFDAGAPDAAQLRAPIQVRDVPVDRTQEVAIAIANTIDVDYSFVDYSFVSDID